MDSKNGIHETHGGKRKAKGDCRTRQMQKTFGKQKIAKFKKALSYLEFCLFFLKHFCIAEGLTNSGSPHIAQSRGSSPHTVHTTSAG